MIDPKLLRNDIDAVNAALAKRGVQLDAAEWAALETRRKDIQSKAESLQAERNAGAKQVGQIKREGGDASEIMARMQAIGDEIKAAETALAALQDEIAQLQARVTELVEQANAAYGPYQQKVNYLQNLVSMKNDALSSYAEFYGRAAGMCGLPDDALPGAQTDAIILQRLAEHDEIARLTAELDKINHVLRGTGFRIASDARPGFGYVLIGHGVEYVPVDDEVGGMI